MTDGSGLGSQHERISPVIGINFAHPTQTSQQVEGWNVMLRQDPHSE